MQDLLLQNYLWLKALHVIAIIAWMAGLLYLPRLFAYHTGATQGSDMAATFEVMEQRLLRIIMNPAMIVAWILGLLLLYANPSMLTGQGWMHAKLTAVVLLSILHMVFAKWRKDFAAGRNSRDARFYKIWNEAPTILMIIIVIMAIVQPF